MAWVSADLAAQLVSDRSKDFTMMLAKHELFSARDDVGFDLDWRDGIQSWTTGTSREDLDFATGLALDGFLHLVTKPSLAATSYTFLIDFGSERAAFDMIILGGHNFDEIAVDNFEIEIADDAAFTTRLQSVALIGSTITSDKRLVFQELGGGAETPPKDFSSVRYARVTVTTPGSEIPEFSELVFGRRAQLSEAPLLEYDDDEQESVVSDFTARSGVTRRFVFNQGRAVRTAEILADGDGEIGVLQQWWRDTEFGTRPFFWIDCPLSEPQDANYMLLRRPAFRFPIIAPKVRRTTLNMFEVPPFLESES